jgi:GNAT superfamily N-acetyltransferase
VHIETVLRPGDLGQVVALHAQEYAQLAGFGVQFEALVAGDLAAFVRQANPDSRIWLARAAHAGGPGGAGEVVGCIAVDRSHDPRAAHLRWFLLAPAYPGIGLGRRLLGEALRFCDGNAVQDTTLWTFQGLDTARALYERSGFTLTRENPGTRWGCTVVEQQFHRRASSTDVR